MSQDGQCDAARCPNPAKLLFEMKDISKQAGEQVTAEYCTVHSVAALDNKAVFKFLKEVRPDG